MLGTLALLSTGLVLHAPHAPIRIAQPARVTPPALAASPEVQAGVSALFLLSLTHGLLPQPNLAPSNKNSGGARKAAPKRVARRANVRLQAPDDAPPPAPAGVRSYDAAQEKSLRKVRLDFGGYPAGKYYTLEKEESYAAAYAAVRKDYPNLGDWSDGEIETTVNSLSSTFQEILIYSPIGPFLVLSAIAIWRDGMAPWGIPPCKDYVDFCANLPSLTFGGM